jgi:hypothetical protein
MVEVMECMVKIHFLALHKALTISKAVTMAVAVVVQEAPGHLHQEMVELGEYVLFGAQEEHTLLLQHKEYYGIY